MLLKNFFESLLPRYQVGLEISMKDNGFIFDLVNFLYYRCYKINPNHGESYIDFPDWIKKKTHQ